MKQSKHLVLNTIALVFLTITSQNVFGQNLDSAFDNAVPVFVDSAETASNWPLTVRGVVVNTKGNAIRETSIAFAGREYRTNAAGEFSFETSPGEAGPLIVKKPGFRKVILKPQSRDLTVVLEPQVINGVYVQTGIFKNKNHPTMQNIMSLMKATELNAMVIDVKDDVGRVSEGLKPYVAEMHAKGLYMIARIVTFKDNIGPRKDPSLAIMDKNTGKPWEDSHGVTYLNPFNPKAHQYVINIAKRAVEAGFDEIEFDYVRFPTDGNRGSVQWSSEFTADSRTLAIATLLKEARRTLGGMGAFIAADVFGDTAYVKTDSGIGQRIEDITPYLDYVCPMVYPSGFGVGTAGVDIPVDHPKEIIEDSVRRYRLRADKETVIRPWLQAFRDYAYNHREYSEFEIRAQIDGSDKVGGVGFLLWNASNRYSVAGLKRKSQRITSRANQVKSGLK